MPMGIAKKGLEGLEGLKTSKTNPKMYILVICKRCIFCILEERLDSLKGSKSLKCFGPLSN